MSGLLIPISLFVKTYTYALPTTVAEFPILAFLVIIAYQAVVDHGAQLGEQFVTRKAFLFTVFAFLAQLTAILISYLRYGDSKQDAGILHGTLNVIGLFLTILVAYFCVRATITDMLAVKRFIRAIFLTLIVFSLFVLLPQLIASLSNNGLHSWVNLVASLFEKRWKFRNWYDNGSYVTTMGRLNGFEAEAGYLAAQIACVFLPMTIAAIANHFDYFQNAVVKSRGWYFLALIWLFVVLFFAKTTTGFLVIGIACLTLFWKSGATDRIVYAIVAVVISIGIFVSYLTVPSVTNLLNQYLFQKGGTDNRRGGTIGLILTFIHNPVIGVGNDWAGSYLMQYVPWRTRNNPEYLTVYSKNSYPILSVWGGWLAQYGLAIVGPILFYIGKRIKLAWTLKARLRASHINDRALFLTLIDSFEIFLIMYFVLALLVFSWSEYYMLISFFFYVSVLNIAENQLSSEESLANEY
ncbi:hypothetical protein [Furfurilactobacillus rossiae]|uniref:O-antigen polymerase n=1 Tax=Furfurilactobacillus rossiae DSM 15814 TaxID=1114972 RepID=A0A0R1RIC3_9LACO|nr:hypothetical protein [Furfurilactobacillus rossiae]KRL56460.1 hypothetical protein FD35_GL002096 [Furfurilactobacillus rossiae DSM 15814]QFR67963.1 hypothetical protein LR814_13045 [Furfurilactobacillus rossiae]QLE60952.1 hypothetical protein LROSRS0_0905 [Furfurilactobacillus rossiae]